jgi:hypothetical protein
MSETSKPCATGATREDETSDPSRFSRKSRESQAKNEIRRYNSMRLFALSIKPRWHGACVPANIMAQGRITFAALITVGFILVFPHGVPAQQSTAPPSSLSTRPLVPGSTESELRPSCDLCRKPEERPGSDLRPQRLRREKGLRPHKNAKGTHRSFDQSIKSTLPRHPLVPPESQGQRDSQARGPAK